MSIRTPEVVALADRLSPALRRAFLSAVDGVRTSYQRGLVEAALRRADIGAALLAMDLDPALWAPLSEGLRSAYLAGGQWAAREATRQSVSRFAVRFDVRSPGAEGWLAQHSLGRARELSNETSAVVRAHLEDAMRRGVNPRTAARSIAGVVGLTQRQLVHVQNAREQLTSGNLSAYLDRALRDRRYDRMVLAAIRDGRALTTAQIETLVGRYQERYVRWRAETIARTEALAAVSAAQREAYQQGVVRGAYRAEHVRRHWHTAGDERVRDSHRAIPGMNPEGRGLDEPFQTPDGPYMDPPIAPNCRCWVEYEVDHLAAALDEDFLPSGR